MQILIGIFQRHIVGWGDIHWTLEQVGPTVQVDHETWPRWHDDGRFAEQPVAIGVVVVTSCDEVWRAECAHPRDGTTVVVGGQPGRDEALTALKTAVREHWHGKVYQT